MMKVTIQTKVKPFTVPNYVIAEMPPGKREEGFKEAPKYHLSELEVRTLDDLCREFRREVFKKAGKAMPPEMELRKP